MFSDIQQYWALLAGAVLASAVAVFVAFRVYTDSARGRLRAEVRALRKCYRERDRAARRRDAAEKQLERLSGRRDSVKPRRIDEAREARDDAVALLRIAQDRALVAETRVRTILVEEYVPKRQEALRRRYLRAPETDGRPATLR